MMSLVRFLIVVAIFATSLAAWHNPLSSRDSKITSAALAFTVIADFFLLITHNYEAGLFAFIFVQIMYNLRYNGLKPAVAASLAAAVTALSFFALGLDMLMSLALAYAVLFGFSLAAAFRSVASNKYPCPNNYLIIVGMTFYAICDVFVAILNSNTEFALRHTYAIAFLVWLFYAPGKFMLALSSFKFGGENK